MLDAKFVRENLDAVIENCRLRGIDPEKTGLLEFETVSAQRAKLLQSVEGQRAARNELAKQAATDESARAESKRLKVELAEAESDLAEAEARYQEILSWIPNMAAEDVPVGQSEADNVEVAAWSPERGEITQQQIEQAGGAAELMPASSGQKDHLEIGRALGIIDNEQSAVVSGARFTYLRGAAVLIQNAVHQLLAEKLLADGFVPVVPPLLVREGALFGSSHFPGDRDQVYAIAGENVEEQNQLYLVGSAEPSLFAYYQDKTLTEEDLPIRMYALTTCFRSEAGSWGKDVRGIKRVHQFDKLEMVTITTPDQARETLEYLRGINEWLLQTLQIPYRILDMCTADLGYFAAAKKYDVEAWLPSSGEFIELMSDSHTTDYQARRLNMRLKMNDGAMLHPHTLNDTGAAMGRLLIAIIEHWQQPDGSLKIPDALRPFTFGQTEVRS